MKKKIIILILFLCLFGLTFQTAFADTIYIVKSGDTLFRIALNHGVSLNELASHNHIVNPALIYVGQEISIPDGTPPTNPPPTTPTPPPPDQPGQIEHIVVPGDTLFRIALKYGSNVVAIVQANQLSNANYIYVGQKLLIPTNGSPPPPPPPPGPTPPPPPPPTNTQLELGGQTHSFAHPDLMKSAGMNWVKMQHKWYPGQNPQDLADRINQAHNSGFKVLLSITGGQTYPAPDSIDFDGYVDFLGGVAALGPDAIEVWNEMNIDFEWPEGQISPASYVNKMLAPAYNRIKSVNGNVMVISGALAPTGFDNGHNAWADDRYIQGMAAAGAAAYFDCIGVHHNAGATSPYATTGHPGGTHYSWYFQATMNLYYNAFGGSRKVCLTETGYLTGDGFPGLPANFSWASGTSLEEHGLWLAEAVQISKQGNKVRMFIVFNVDLTHYDPNGDPQAGYAILRPDGSCPACAQLKAAIGP